MKKPLLILSFFLFNIVITSQAQKIIADCTINYEVTSSDSKKNNDFAGASKTIYIRGKEIRIDLNSSMFNQTIFYNGNTGEATVLKEVGQSKYISHYNAAEWQKENDLYNGVKLSFSDVTKNILNYECKEVILQLKNGNNYTVYYVPDILPSASENPFEFKNIPGLILEYETSTSTNKKVNYTATKISFDPVPAFLFEIPKTGYRILH
jgi:GLPGLI family protein